MLSAEAVALEVDHAGEDGQDAEGGQREGKGDAGGDRKGEGTVTGTASPLHNYT